MKVTRDPADGFHTAQVGTMTPGTTVLNSSGNVCLVVRDDNERILNDKIRLVNLASGMSYTVNSTCEYEVVDAQAVWRKIQGVTCR